MKTLLILLFSLNVFASEDKVTSQIIRNSNNTMSEAKAKKLASLIVKVSSTYNLNPNLFAAILMQESTYNIKAVNKSCGYARQEASYSDTVKCVAQDLGISQINVKTIEAYGFDVESLQNDLEYSIMAGAKVLSWFKKTYKDKEPNTWYCRYNQGTRSYDKIEAGCLDYKKLVDRYR